jgi:hypothetical protein
MIRSPPWKSAGRDPFAETRTQKIDVTINREREHVVDPLALGRVGKQRPAAMSARPGYGGDHAGSSQSRDFL